MGTNRSREERSLSLSDGGSSIRALAPVKEGEALAPVRPGLLVPMGDGPLGHRVWEPYDKIDGKGVTLGTTDHTEWFCRVSAYLRDARMNARRLCACWNAFVGVPLEEIECIAKERSGWEPPSYEDMWRHPDAPPTRTVRATGEVSRTDGRRRELGERPKAG